MAARLALPSLDLLPEYVAALEQGWSPDNLRGKAAADEQLERIAADPLAFVTSLNNPGGLGPPITRVDGSTAPRLPSVSHWIWDDGFCGSIGFRWSPGGADLPGWFTYGHVGYAVPPRRRGRGYATQALSLLLPFARDRGLEWLELTTQADNVPSQRVVAKNGGQIVAREDGGGLHGGGTILRWRIAL